MDQKRFSVNKLTFLASILETLIFAWPAACKVVSNLDRERTDLESIGIPHSNCEVGGARACLSIYLGAALKRADLANCFDQLRTGLDRNLFVSRCCT